MRPSARLNGGQLARARSQFSNFQRRSRAPIYERGGVLSRAPTFLNRVPRDRRSGRCVDLRLAAGLPGADGDGVVDGRDQLGADSTRRTTVGVLWETMSGRPLSADLLDWPPDLFALTSVMLQRSGAYRFALSPPPGHQWPPGSRSGWSTTVETAGRAWSGVVDVPGEPVPPLLVSMMEVLVAAATTPLEDLATGVNWELCAALLTLHAIADEACAGLGVALTASNPIGCCYRGRARSCSRSAAHSREFRMTWCWCFRRCARPQRQVPPFDRCPDT